MLDKQLIIDKWNEIMSAQPKGLPVNLEGMVVELGRWVEAQVNKDVVSQLRLDTIVIGPRVFDSQMVHPILDVAHHIRQVANESEIENLKKLESKELRHGKTK